ncbi:MAG: signal peptidase I [Acidiferrobacterales bacterium]|nr:signal peptidase I [Acidiferrobacterales bacterium]
MFEIILFALVIVTGITILLCKFVFKVIPEGSNKSIPLSEYVPEPWYLDYARSFFPVLLIVFLLRGFIAEPFRIPSGSMLPTLEVGDFILVNKFKYGLRLPITYSKVIPISDPQRGDIMVFRFPGDNKTNYIKRVIGLPGDRVEYSHKQLKINGELINVIADGDYTPFDLNGRKRVQERFLQALPNSADVTDSIEFSILLEKRSSSANRSIALPENRTFIVPQGQYFVMGDNRDHSLDGRFWGFVPDENVVGKAFFIWFHWNTNRGGGVNLSRIGEKI